MIINEKPIACKQLLQDYAKVKKIYKTERIIFDGAEGYDVYNISAPFTENGETYIAGRVEKRDEEVSTIRFFKRITDSHYALSHQNMVLTNLQDPCITHIGGELIVGGTQIDLSPSNSKQIVGWRTAYLKGKSIDTLKFWRAGPHNMKDVRLLDYNGKLLVLTRPQGDECGYGKIGSIIFDNADEFNYNSVTKATIHSCHFIDGEWGGANEMFILSNGLIGVLGHIACMHKDLSKHYYSMAFCFDPKSQKSSAVKIIAERSDFGKGEAKRGDLVDVLFTGGLIRGDNGLATLYTGVSDAEGHYAVINDPFTEYEKA